MEHEPDFLATLGGQRSELVCSLWPFIAYLAMCLPNLFDALPRCGGLHRSAVATVTQDGGSNRMVAEELEPLRGRVSWPGRRGNSSRSSEGRVSQPEVDSCSVRRRSGFPRVCGAASAFQMLSGCTTGSRCFLDCQTLRRKTTRCRCRAATEHRINIAHLVLHTIWNGELSSERESKKKDTNTEHDWRGRQD